MKLFKQRPGEIFLALFVTAGLTFTALATIVEMNSGKAGRAFGRGFDAGLIDASGWVAEEN